MDQSFQNQMNRIIVFIDIIIQTPETEERDLLKGIQAESDSNGNLILSSILRALSDLGYWVLGCNVLYHSFQDKMWVMINKNQDLISKDGIENNRIQLKFRNPP